ncbi:hypothetical protein JNJ66_00130 [Candidatus Saccharibacteria bacterium]|nr:hypothetical protein [Candidatus Saccharibacteria bacterium]
MRKTNIIVQGLVVAALQALLISAPVVQACSTHNPAWYVTKLVIEDNPLADKMLVKPWGDMLYFGTYDNKQDVYVAIRQYRADRTVDGDKVLPPTAEMVPTNLGKEAPQLSRDHVFDLYEVGRFKSDRSSDAMADSSSVFAQFNDHGRMIHDLVHTPIKLASLKQESGPGRPTYLPTKTEQFTISAYFEGKRYDIKGAMHMVPNPKYVVLTKEEQRAACTKIIVDNENVTLQNAVPWYVATVIALLLVSFLRTSANKASDTTEGGKR